MIEIVFLGTGASVPSRKRNLSSIWLHYSGQEGESFLFDCGEGTQRQLMASKLSFMKIDRIFVTHWHADHWAGLIGLIQTMNLEKRKKPLYIYGPEAERFVSNILELGYWAPRFRVVPEDCPFEGDEITPLYSTKEFGIFSTPARHSVPAVAYCFREKDRVNVDIRKAQKLFGLRQGRLVGKLKRKGEISFRGKKIRLEDVALVKKGLKVVYTGDTQPCKNLETISKETDVIIHDSTFESQDETIMHSGAREAAELARKVRAGHLVLTHFSRRYQDISILENEAKKIFPETVSARDFMRIALKKGVFKVFR
jgi:ribonuclease Z